MNSTFCEREQDVLDAIAAGRWPDRLSGELSTHISACTICRDLAPVAHGFAHDYESAFIEARLPSAGLVWWRAEIRARQEAARAAVRPITLVQAIAGACGIGVALALLAWSLLGVSAGDFWAAFDQPQLLPLLYLALGALVILGSVALYLVLSDE